MTVDHLMNPDPVTTSLDQTFAGALQTLLERRIRSLPVIDSAGAYRGMFDLYDIWELLLPRAATLESKPVADLSFMAGSADELRRKLREAGPRPIAEFLNDEESPSIHPDTPVEEAILLLFRRNAVLPVIERKSRRLLGIVTPWEILNSLR